MVTILVVEDNEHTRLLTEARLKKYYNVVTAENGSQAIDIFYEKQIDLIVTDIMMPVMDGYEMLKCLRDNKEEVPILFLTAKSTFESKRMGYDLGIDDYITKPIDYEELLLRIKALLRRANISSKMKINIGTFIMDENDYSVYNDGNKIELTKKEFELLFKLLSYPNKVMTKIQLLEAIWGYESNSSEDTIKTHINKIRNKLKDVKYFEIISVKGLGYKVVMLNAEEK
ncbi:MAG: response regulator transcription factor [Bacilli bacterium]|nr:response regulator transcription factor [Bacilli bacterium]